MFGLSNLILALATVSVVTAQHLGSLEEKIAARAAANGTYSIGVVLFPGFEPLDVFGPVQIIKSISFSKPITFSYIAATTGLISTIPPPLVLAPGGNLTSFAHTAESLVKATHTFANAPPLDILIVPGGLGINALILSGDRSIQRFIIRRFSRLDYLLSVCTGAAALASAGVLDGKFATTNKKAWAFVTQQGPNVKWVPSARWVVDGKIWSSSGVSAGIDMTYAFLKHLYGAPAINPVMNTIEYAPHTDPTWDPFSIVHKVPGANVNGSLIDCTGPVSV